MGFKAHSSAQKTLTAQNNELLESLGFWRSNDGIEKKSVAPKNVVFLVLSLILMALSF